MRVKCYYFIAQRFVDSNFMNLDVVQDGLTFATYQNALEIWLITFSILSSPIDASVPPSAIQLFREAQKPLVN